MPSMPDMGAAVVWAPALKGAATAVIPATAPARAAILTARTG